MAGAVAGSAGTVAGSAGTIPGVSRTIAATVITAAPVAVSDVNATMVDDGAAVPVSTPITPAPPAAPAIHHGSHHDPDAEHNRRGRWRRGNIDIAGVRVGNAVNHRRV